MRCWIRSFGVVHIHELVAATQTDETQSLRTVAREPYVVPETKDVDELLTELRKERERIAIVVDEFGTTAGIVTIEDIVEEIIGEILTETETPPIRWLDDRTALVRGELNVHEANQALDTDLPETSEFETVAGLILAEAGRLVQEGEGVYYDGTRLVVETAGRNRILEVRVELAEEETASGSDETEEGELEEHSGEI